MTHVFLKRVYIKYGIMWIISVWLSTFYLDYILITGIDTNVWVWFIFALISAAVKAWIIVNFFRSLYLLQRTFVLSEAGCVVYHRHHSWRKSASVQYAEYHIDEIERMSVERAIAGNCLRIIVKGRVEVGCYGDDNEQALHRRTIKRLSIPGYFENMEEIERVLNSMCPPENEKDTLFF